jgi:hypothetical protein
MENREPYVKPLVIQLHYAAETEVAQLGACKTTGSARGPTIGGCRTTNPFVPCQTLGS